MSRFWPGVLRDLEALRDVLLLWASLAAFPAVSETLFLVAFRDLCSRDSRRVRFLPFRAMMVMEAVLIEGWLAF